MCDSLSSLRSAVAAYAARLEVEHMSPTQAASVVEDATAIEASIQAIRALASSRASDSSAWKKDGHRSAQEALARATGSSVSRAKELIDTGRRLRSQPELSSAALRGEVSFAQASLIADASEADPLAQRRLMRLASSSSYSELKERCAQTKAASFKDEEAHRRDIHRRRYLRSYCDTEGMWHLRAGGDKELGAQVMAEISARSSEIFEDSRKEGTREPPEAYGFDALVALARDAASGSSATGASRARRAPPMKLLVRIDYDSFLRGARAEGETCELAGFGAVSVGAVRDLIEMGDPFVAAILTRGKKLVGVAHLGRKPTSYQQSALEWLFPTCAAAGCPHSARLERDHRVDWSKTHFTMLDMLDLLCSHHHHLKTRDNWALVEGSGKRPFVSPDDPRHPGHDKKKSSAPSTGPPIAFA